MEQSAFAASRRMRRCVLAETQIRAGFLLDFFLFMCYFTFFAKLEHFAILDNLCIM